MASITRSAIPNTTITESAFYTIGYQNPGDAGAGAFYVPGNFQYFDPVQDHAGNWWSLAPFQVMKPEFWGGFGSGDATQAFLNAIQAAVTAANGAGGVVEAGNPAGYSITSLFLQNGVMLKGRGSTPLRCNTAQGTAINLYGSKSGIEGFALSRTSGSSSGNPVVGIQFGYNEQGSQQIARRNTLNGFDIGIDVVTGVIWSIEENDIMGSTYDAIRINNTINPDGGDGLIFGNTLANGGSGDAGIKYQSGGGLKVESNKILGFSRALDCFINDGASTVDLLVTGNSFENQTINALRIGHAGNGSFGTITVTGNEFANAPVLTSFESGVSNIAYTGNAHNISVYAGVAIADGADNIAIDDSNTFVSCPATIVDNRTGYPNGHIDYVLTKGVNVGSTSDYINVARLVLPAYRGAFLDVVIEGTLQMVGSVSQHFRYLLNRDGGGVGATTIEASAVGAAVDFALDGSSTGSLILKIKRNGGAGGTEFDGTVTVRVEGRLAGFYPL